MKVLHVIPGVSKDAGGPSHAIFPMCEALSDLGIEVVLATTDAGLDRGIDTLLEQGHEGLSVQMFPSQIGRSFKYSRPFANWLSKNVSAYDVVHIHAVFNHACIAAARACRKQAVPYVVRPLGTLDPWGMNQKSLRKKVFWHAGVKRMLASAAAVHYTARAEQEATEQFLGLNHGVVVPLGVSLSNSDRSVLARRLQGSFPSLAVHPYVLVLSRLLPTKGLDALLEAFLSLTAQQDFENWRLVLAGDGPTDYLAKLKQLVVAAGAFERILFPGWVSGEAKDALLQGAALLSLPSYHENFGLCVMEALARGVPVLISPHVNLAVEVQKSEAGWVVPVEKLALEMSLKAALSSESERSQRGKAGAKVAIAFRWPNIAQQLVDLYQSVSKPNKSAAKLNTA